MHILIIGIRAAKATMLKRMYKGKVRFTFYTDQHNTAIKTTGTFDHVISCTNFTSHRTETKFSSHPSFIRIGGSSTDIDKVLMNLIGSQS